FGGAMQLLGEGNLPDETRAERVRPIEARAPAIYRDVRRRVYAAVIVSRLADPPRERVIARDQQSSCEAAVNLYLHRIVIRVGSDTSGDRSRASECREEGAGGVVVARQGQPQLVRGVQVQIGK